MARLHREKLTIAHEGDTRDELGAASHHHSERRHHAPRDGNPSVDSRGPRSVRTLRQIRSLEIMNGSKPYRSSSVSSEALPEDSPMSPFPSPWTW